MQPQIVVDQLGGIAHRRTLRERGIRPEHLAQAETDATLVRVRRDWFATPECNSDLVDAVRVGGRLSCISAADARKIWVVTDGALHVAVAPTASRLHLGEGSRKVVVHWNRSPTRMDATLALEPVENTLAHIARCQQLDFAVAAFDSAVRTNAIPLRQLQHFSRSQSTAFRKVVSLVNPLADTGIETIPRVRLAWLGIIMVPQARWSLENRASDSRPQRRASLRARATLETSRVQRDRDLKQDARLRLQGYAVFRFSRDQILFDWPSVLSTIYAALEHGLHRWPR